MKKRGQVTIFIIIAIIILGAIGLYFSLRGGLQEEVLSPEAENVYLFVQSCIEDTGAEAVYTMGQNGGYFLPPEFSTEAGIPYYYADGQGYIPPKERVGTEVSRYIDEMLFFCTRNFADFPELEIDQGEIKTTSQIVDEKVIFDVEYSIRVVQDNSTTILKEFNDIEIPVRLGVIYNAISEIIRDQLTRENICLSCISEIAIENDLKIDLVSLENGAIIFTIKDENSLINDLALEFKFANKYG